MDASSLPRRSSRAIAHPRLVAVALVCAVLLLVLAGAMYLYDHSRRDVIANGVRIGSVNVGGLHREAALDRVRQQLAGRLERPLSIDWGTRRWTLTPREARLTLDVPDMVDQALAASRGGSIFSRTVRGLFGGRLPPRHPDRGELFASGRGRLDCRGAGGGEPSASGCERAGERDCSQPDTGAGGDQDRQRQAWRADQRGADRRRAGPHAQGADPHGQTGCQRLPAGGQVPRLHHHRSVRLPAALLPAPEARGHV